VNTVKEVILKQFSVQAEYDYVPQGWEIPESHELKYCRVRLKECPKSQLLTPLASTPNVSISYFAVFI
jgi:hypothetical protein